MSGSVAGPARAGLRRQIDELPGVIRACNERLEDDARRVLASRAHLGLENVVLTGCGDSAIAAGAAAFAWDHLAGVPAVARNAMDVARYLQPHGDRWRPGGQLLVAVSSSGRVARVVEAARRFAPLSGTIVCAATADRAGPLASAADVVLCTASDRRSDGPGLCSYVLSVLALLHLAVRCGEARGRYTTAEAARLRAELARSADVVEAAVDGAAEPLATLARSWAAFGAVEFLGSGPGRASAGFGAAKVVEAVGLSAMDQDIEEFLHLQYFEARAEDTATVLISASNTAAHSRARELQGYLETLRRPYVLLTDATGVAARAIGHPPVPELFAPIVHAALLAILAAELADVHDAVPGRGGTGQWRDSRGGAAVRHVEENGG